MNACWFLLKLALFVELYLVLDGLPGFFLFSAFFQLIVYFFGVEDEEDALEEFLADLVGGGLGGVFAVVGGAVAVGLFELLDEGFQLDVLGLDLEEHFLAVLVDAVVGVVLPLAAEGPLESHGVLLDLGKVDLYLADRHLGDELVAVHFLLGEDGVLELLPHLLDDVEPSVHLVVRRLHLLQPLERVQLETPGAALNPSAVEVVADREGHLKNVMEVVVVFERLEGSGEMFYVTLQLEVKLLPHAAEEDGLDSVGVLGDRNQLLQELLKLAKVLHVSVVVADQHLFLLGWDEAFRRFQNVRNCVLS